MTILSRYSEVAEAHTERLYLSVRDRHGFEAGETWLKTLEEATRREVDFVATPARRAMDQEESRRTGHDIFRFRVRSWGIWFVSYRLLDEDRDGEVEVLEIIGIRSATGPQQ